MTDDETQADVANVDSDPHDSDQAFRAHALRKVSSRKGQGSRGYGAQSNLLFEQAMAQTRMAICLSDPNQEDAPIIFANSAFQELTGYDEVEVLGRNCRFLQGAATDRKEVARVKRVLIEEQVAVVELLNYRKDGGTFWNALHIGPIYDDDGELLYYFGSQWDVTEMHIARSDYQEQQRLIARELSHRMKNMFAVINAVVMMVARGGPERKAIGNDISERILALGRAHEATLADVSEHKTADFELLLRGILSAYDTEDRVMIKGGSLSLDSNIVSMIALTIHELAINAVKHGALSLPEGRVDISWQCHPPTPSPVGSRFRPEVLELRWQERGGPAIAGVPERSGFGSSIVESLLQVVQGDVDRDWQPDGVVVSIRLPLAD